MAELLLELYSEEIPPKLQIEARIQLKEYIEKSFKEENIKYKELNVYSSPCRLTLITKGLEEKIKILERLRNSNGRSIPTLLSDEMDLNLFLKADNNEVARALGMEDANALDVFTRLRSLKDNF